MPNSYYNHSSFPAANSAGTSASMRSELDAISTGFSALPTLTGNSGKVAVVNTGETALIASPNLVLNSVGSLGLTAYPNNTVPQIDSAGSIKLTGGGVTSGYKSAALTFDISGGGGRAGIYSERISGFGGKLCFAVDKGDGSLTQVANIDSGGNLNVGDAATYGSLTVNTGLDRVISFTPGQNTGPALSAVNSAGNSYRPMEYFAASHQWYSSPQTSPPRAAMTLDATGNLTVTNLAYGVGTPSITSLSSGFAGLFHTYGTTNNYAAVILTRESSNGAVAQFCWDGGTTAVGNIAVSSTATSYVTTSDYRLKENIAPLSAAGNFIDALKPVKYTWKLNGEASAGFIAHELQEVSPSSVQGEKDAVDENGKPKYQSVEYGSPEVIANIVAELQSLRKRIAVLEGS